MKLKLNFQQGLLCLAIVLLIIATPQYSLAHPDHGKLISSCQSDDPYLCLSSQVDHSDVILEATLTESKLIKKGIIENTFVIEKAFKGKYEKEKLVITIDEKELLKKLFGENYQQDHQKHYLKPGDVGTTFIIFLEDHHGKLEPIFSELSLFYHTSSRKKATTFSQSQRTNLIHSFVNGNELIFKESTDLYEFLNSHEKTQYSDKTKKHFKPEISDHEIKSGFNGGTVISSFTPSVPAGVNQILEIEGSGFGLSKGQIKFLDVASGGADGAIILDNWDMSLALWSNTNITVILPSRVHDITTIMGGFTIWQDIAVLPWPFVVSPTSNPDSDLSSGRVEIPYSVDQVLEADDGIVDFKGAIRLATTSNNGAIEFSVHNDLYENCEAMAAVNKALKEWSCKTGINWFVSNVTTDDLVEGDGISTITLSNEFSGGQAPTPSVLCNSLYYEKTEYDIYLNPDPAPFLGTYYSIVLHELGHHLGLNHTDPGLDGIADLMGPNGTGTDFITADDVTGAQFVLNNSLSILCEETIDFTIKGDYAMRDLDSDIGDEPNCAASEGLTPGDRPDVYRSPDLWNCHSPNNSCNFNNQEPLEGNFNWIYARVENISEECDISGGLVHFYWTVGSTGEVWDEDWIDDIENGCTVGDYIGFQALGTLAPGEEVIVSREWIPPVINELVDCEIFRYPWDEDNETYQVCLLARIEAADDRIFNEQISIEIEDNVVNSNNIVTRNTKLLDDPYQIIPPLNENGPTRVAGDPSNVIIYNNNDKEVLMDIVIQANTPMDFGVLDILLSESMANKLTGETVYESNNVSFFNEEGEDLLIIPNVLMNPRERQLIGLRLALTEEQIESYSQINKELSFSVSHRSSNGETINASSVCHFILPTIMENQQFRFEVPDSEILKAPEIFDQIVIFDINGRIVKTFNSSIEINTLEVLEHLTHSGIYIVSYMNKGDVVFSEKIFFQKE